ncbi:MAG: Ig-like domain-containing protein [Bacteroidales bacterium]
MTIFDAANASTPLTAATDEDAGVVNVNLLEGASAPAGTQLAVSDFVQTSGPPATYSVADGVLSVDAGQFAGLNEGETATLSFSYMVNAGAEQEAQSVTLTVAGHNDAPVVAGPLAAVTDEDADVFFLNLLAGASDVDGGKLSVTGLTLLSGQDVHYTVDNGVLSLDPGQYNGLGLGQDEVLRFGYTITDGRGGSVSQTAEVTVEGRNDSPQAADSAELAAIDEDTAAPAGASVASLFASKFSDPDSGGHLTGLAIVGNPGSSGSSTGRWQYSSNGGQSWLDVGEIAAETALMLSASALLRFVPAVNYNGTPPGLDVLLVDDSYGGAWSTGDTRVTGSIPDLRAPSGRCGTSSLSVRVLHLSTTVNAVNDAPTLTLEPVGGGFRGGEEFLISTHNAGEQDGNTLVALADGGFLAVWDTFDPASGDASLGSIAAQRFAADGSKVGTEYRLNTTTTGGQWSPALVRLQNGTLVAVWSNATTTQGSGRGDVSGRILAADGTPLSAEFKVNVGQADLTWSSEGAPSVIALASGGFLVSWVSYEAQAGYSDATGIVGRVFNADGTMAGPEFNIAERSSPFQNSVKITALNNGGFVAVWVNGASPADVHAQRFDAQGCMVGPEFSVPTDSSGMETDPVVAGLADGGYVVVWHAGATGSRVDGIYLQRFDAAGEPLRGETLVASEGFVRSPAITALPDGGYMISWTFQGAMGGDQDGGVAAQRYDAAAVKVGDPFVVNQVTNDTQANADMVVLNDGRVVFSWTSRAADWGDTASGNAVGRILTPPPLFVEGGDAVAVFAALNVADVDSSTLAWASVSVTNHAEGDVLSFTPQSGITGSYDSLTGVLTLTGTASVADYQAALQSVFFSNTSDNPATSNRSVTLTVGDGLATSAALTQTVQVAAVNDAPILTVSDIHSSLVENQAGLTLATVAATDPEGEPVTLSISDKRFEIVDGVLRLKAGETLDYEAVNGAAGSVTVTATDAQGASSSQTVAYQIVNVDEPLVAADDAVGIVEDQRIVIDILGNDLHASNVRLPTVTSVSATHGTVSVNADGTLTYVPGANRSDPAVITYTLAEDGKTSSAQVAVTITAKADAPVIHFSPGSGDVYAAVPLNLSAVLTDLDGSETLSQVVIRGLPAQAVLSAGTRAANGDWLVDAAQLAGLTVTAGRGGSYPVTITVTSTEASNGDARTTSVTGTLKITGNAKPVLTIADVTPALTENQAGLTLATVAATDPEGESVTFSVNDNRFEVVNGVLRLKAGEALDYEAVNGGAGSVTVTASDAQGASSSQTVGYQIVNVDEPLVATDDAVGIVEDQAIVIDILGNDLHASNVRLPTVTSVSATHGTVSVNADGTLTYMPGANRSDPAVITYTLAEDGKTSSAQVAVTITAKADAPWITFANAAGDIYSDIPLNLSAALVDIDGSETLSPITISGLPADAELSAGTRAANGDWVLSAAQLAGLTVTTATGGVYTVTATATATEAGNGDASSTWVSVTLNVDGNWLVGTQGNDHIFGQNGGDRIVSLGGDDYLDGRAGNDYLRGSAGNDVLLGGADSDTLDGGDGNDCLDGGTGTNTLLGGAGDDRFLTQGAARSVIDAGSGNDTVVLSGGNATVTGGSGRDTYVLAYESLFGASATNLIQDFAAGLGGDVLDLSGLFGSYGMRYWDGRSNFLTSGITLVEVNGSTHVRALLDRGDAGSMQVTVAVLVNVPKAALTADNFSGLANFSPTGGLPSGLSITSTATGAESLAGSGGDDVITGGAGNSTLMGGCGNDTLSGGAGNDTLSGGTGNDLLLGGAGNDWIYGGTPDFNGDLAKDTVDAGDGDDRIFLGLGLHTVTAGDGNDEINLSGSSGTINIVDAGSGNDVINLGGYWGDTLTTGAGQDVIRASGSSKYAKATIVTDFAAGPGGDKIDLRALLERVLVGWMGDGNPFGTSGFLRVRQVGADTVIELDRDTVMGWANPAQPLFVLKGVTASSLSMDNFIPPYDPAGLDAVTQERQTVLYDQGNTVVCGEGCDTITFGRSVVGSSGTPNQILNFKAGAGGDVLDLEAFYSAFGNFFSGSVPSSPFNINYISLKEVGGSTYVQVYWNKGAYGSELVTLAVLVGVPMAALTGDNFGQLYNFSPSGQLPAGITLTSASDTSETLLGTGGNDVIRGGNGGGTIRGGAGNDTIWGGTGDDTIYGGAGRDVIFGGAGNDWIVGDEAGASGLGYDTIDGGDGNDRIFVGNGTHTVLGGAGCDEITLCASPNTGAYVIDAGSGDDIIHLGGVQGSAGGTVTTGSGRDIIDTGSVWQSLVKIVITDFTAGLGGDRIALDKLLAGMITGWDGTCNPFGPSGFLRLRQDGADTVIDVDRNGAGPQNYGFQPVYVLKNVQMSDLTCDNFIPPFDPTGAASFGTTLAGGFGTDILSGSNCNDYLAGNDGADTLVGNDGLDILSGGAGNDVLAGGGGGDVLYGGDGDDALSGDGEADWLYGDAGRDTLSGGAGNDTLSGGAGQDTYLFGLGGGVDTIVNAAGNADGAADTLRFGAGIDRNELWFAHVGSNLEISVLGGSDKVVLAGWYGSDPNAKLQSIELADGSILDRTRVEGLVSAMAAFAPPAAAQAQLTVQQHQSLDSVIAANWQHA